MKRNQLLVSVRSMEEARQAWEAGVDFIDLKNPLQGSLGALSVQEVSAIRQAIPKIQKISATVGDLPMDPDTLCNAILGMAVTDVDYIKVGFFPGGDWGSSLVLMKHLAGRGIPLIAVLFAEEGPPLPGWIERLQQSGFMGVMLDTRLKNAGRLPDLITPAELASFVSQCQSLGLLTGLAGSLRLEDLSALRLLEADYLGFRGGVCDQH
ncbi:MAG: hypothetical protein RIQ52_1864, partial [Pseudomonadota bacterium]